MNSDFSYMGAAFALFWGLFWIFVLLGVPGDNLAGAWTFVYLLISLPAYLIGTWHSVFSRRFSKPPLVYAGCIAVLLAGEYTLYGVRIPDNTGSIWIDAGHSMALFAAALLFFGVLSLPKIMLGWLCRNRLRRLGYEWPTISDGYSILFGLGFDFCRLLPAVDLETVPGFGHNAEGVVAFMDLLINYKLRRI